MCHALAVTGNYVSIPFHDQRLLTLSRASSGPSHLETERVELGDLADEIAGYLGVLAEENGQSITVQRAPSVVCDVDRLVLRQAVVNLVDNAIKYSPADSEIAIRTASRPI